MQWKTAAWLWKGKLSVSFTLSVNRPAGKYSYKQIIIINRQNSIIAASEVYVILLCYEMSG
jgi:hypothetical protein